jgi:TonB family protein
MASRRSWVRIPSAPPNYTMFASRFSRSSFFLAVTSGISFITLASFLAVPSSTQSVAAKKAAKSVPTSFYIAREMVSDASPFWFRYVLDVRPEGSGSRVRYIRIAPLDPICTHVVAVQAMERTLPSVTPAQIAHSAKLCSATEQSVTDSVNRNTVKGRIFELSDSEMQTVVADCENRQRVFRFPYPGSLNYKAFRRDSPDGDAIWNLATAVYSKAFGNSSIFENLSPAEEEQSHRLGETFIPELRNGSFDAGLQPDFCPPLTKCGQRTFADILNEYHGPMPGFSPVSVSLRECDRFRFKSFVIPSYPALGRQVRIQGTVELEVTVDRSTGEVIDARIVSGHPLLYGVTLDAVRKWVFDPESVSEAKFHLHVDFALRCPEE